MRKVIIRGDGALPLDDESIALGFKPGVVVRVSRLSSGSLLVAIDDSAARDVVSYTRLAPSPRRPLALGRRPA